MKPGTILDFLTIQAIGIAHFSSDASVQKPRTVVNAVISKGINKALQNILVPGLKKKPSESAVLV